MVLTVFVNQDGVDAITAGPAVFAIISPVTVDVLSTDSVKMEPVFVHKDGMADTAHCRVVKMGALVTANALLRMVNIDAFASKAGLELTVLSHWR